MEVERAPLPKRPVGERIRDWSEVEGDLPQPALAAQASRCMDCGIPFCHQGCPLGNHVPDWNDLVFRGRWREAGERLHATNNFPEITGRVCPAPCEAACVLALDGAPVTIRQVEKQVADRALAEGWAAPEIAPTRTGRRVAIVGSGPAGLAAAQQLARAGHDVVVFENSDRIGGLLRYGIPDFKLAKETVDLRVEQMRAEGVIFETRTAVGAGLDVEPAALRRSFDAVVLAVGAEAPRSLRVPGVELDGVHLAMDYLTVANRAVAGDYGPSGEPPISAAGRRVAILGGGDTGADCLGTAHRQGAAQVWHFHYKPAPPLTRPADTPWPWWPMTLQSSSSHEEGGERGWSVTAAGFEGDGQGRVRAMRLTHVEWAVDPATGRRAMRPVPGRDEERLEVDMVLLAVGFTGVAASPLVEGFGLALDGRGRIPVGDDFRSPPPAHRSGRPAPVAADPPAVAGRSSRPRRASGVGRATVSRATVSRATVS
jgi:glutamate synthase (NADPH/NADH) small chain